MELLSQAQGGRLGLPEFRRDSIWKPRHLADFLRSVARDCPGGRFLLLERPQDFACKPLARCGGHWVYSLAPRKPPVQYSVLAALGSVG